MSSKWWREKIPEGEQVLWFGRPPSGCLQPHAGWSYKIPIRCPSPAWLASQRIADTVRDFGKLISCTAVRVYVMWWDRLIRSRRIYVVTDRSAWSISEIFKPKRTPIHPKLSFHRSGQNIVFSHLRFLVVEYLPDPDAAMKALTQAREAAT